MTTYYFCRSLDEFVTPNLKQSPKTNESEASAWFSPLADASSCHLHHSGEKAASEQSAIWNIQLNNFYFLLLIPCILHSVCTKELKTRQYIRANLHIFGVNCLIKLYVDRGFLLILFYNNKHISSGALQSEQKEVGFIIIKQWCTMYLCIRPCMCYSEINNVLFH